MNGPHPSDPSSRPADPAAPAAGWQPSCPLPTSRYPRVLLGHGGGGRLMQELLDETVLPRLGLLRTDGLHDGALLAPGGPQLAFTTDAFVVDPLFFPGGDIGSLSVHGTVNDLAMCGARPLALSAALVLEEGLPMDVLERVLDSMHAAARACGTQVVTGDTKVVERRTGEGLWITTTGVGRVAAGASLAPWRLRPGDVLLVSGDIGRHGVAVMSRREGLAFETEVLSDSAAVTEPALALLAAGLDVRCMRDPSRGGLAAVLDELARSSGRDLAVREADVPVSREVSAACELLGLDPLMVPCEGRFLAVVPADDADAALRILERFDGCARAARIGVVGDTTGRTVQLENALGVRRGLILPSGEQLPRIC